MGRQRRGAGHDWATVGCATTRVLHERSAKLMEEFPYALCMEKADRNLLEIINNERLAATSLYSIRSAAAGIGKCVAALHSVGIVHGDLKPRNIVRTGQGHLSNPFKLIDFDMAFMPASSSTSISEDWLPDTCASASKVQSSNAYAPPELARWASEDRDLHDDGVLRFDCPFSIDVWAFGATLYHMVTGHAMLLNTYDHVTRKALKRLITWNGLDEDDERQIQEAHPDSEV